ncbi:AAA family ATPase [Actinokineospora sp. NPDC004072]
MRVVEPGLTLNTVRTGTVIGSIVQARSVVFGSGDVPVDEAVCDPGPVFADVLADGFTGRGWLIERIDRFLGERQCGYLWVEGDAGVGKTALAAHLVRERGWVGHFARLTRGGLARVGLRNLAGQLARLPGLDDLAPGGLLPERLCTPEGFVTALAKAVGRIRPPLVLVMDGADEAERVAGALPWGLPVDLPAGVFVVGTYRTGSPPPLTAAPTEVVRVRADAQENIADLEEHLARLLPDRIAKELTARCRGLWVYQRHVRAELRQGTQVDLGTLPTGLARYYANRLEGWSQADDWHSALLPLLATFAVAGEPLAAPSLASLSGVDEDVVRAHCHTTLRPFLSAVDNPDGRRFQLYHASLTELLSGVRPRDDGPEQDWKWWDILSAASLQAHSRVADQYLHVFGPDGLQALVADPALAAVDGGYPLRHLARHLVAARRYDDLHSLLRAGPTAWFAAHDHANTIDDFLADVATARALHTATTDRALSAGMPAPTLCDEAHYALVAASVVSRANAVSAELAAALVAERVWTPERAVAHARRLPTASARAHTLAVLAATRPDLVDQAFAAADQVTFPYARVEVLLKLIPLAHDRRTDLVDHVLAAAADHPEVFADLAPWLSPDRLQVALSTASDIPHARARARALTALAPYVPEASTGALAAIRAISAEHDRAEAITGLAPHLSDAQLSDALDIAAAITGHHRLPAMAALAGVDTVLPEAHALTDKNHRADTLARLAPYLSVPQLRDALALAVGDRRIDLLLVLARHLREAAEPAFAAVSGIGEPSARATALTRLAPHLPAGRRRAALRAALAAATAVAPRKRDEPAGLAWPGPTETHAVAAARRSADPVRPLADIARMRDDHKAVALAAHGPHLRGDDHTTALALAVVITDERSRSTALTGLAPHLLDAAQLGAALAATPYGDRGLLCAIVARADTVAGDEDFTRLLREALRDTGRDTCAAILAAAVPRLTALTGTDAAAWLDAALREVRSWWTDS